jgi:hypothetical protein
MEVSIAEMILLQDKVWLFKYKDNYCKKCLIQYKAWLRGKKLLQ